MRLAVLVPGQGNQHPNMFERVRNDPGAREVLDCASEFLHGDPETLLRARTDKDLYQNRFAQPLICTGVLATWAALAPQLPTPGLFLGYSVGELAAYGCAGALEVGETLRLARRRAAFMDAASDPNGTRASGLLALRGLAHAVVADLCTQHRLEFAAINGSEHYVIGGLHTDLLAAAQAARDLGAYTVRHLGVGVASHTSLLRAAGISFMRELNASPISDPSIPLLSAVDATWVDQRGAGINALATQLYLPLAWSECMAAAVTRGYRVFLELGPGSALSRMMRESHPHVEVRSIEEFDSLDAAAKWAHQALEHTRATNSDRTLAAY